MDIGIHTGNFPHLCTDHPGPNTTDYAAMRAAGFDCADLSAICDICGPYYTSDLQTAKEMAKKERKAAAAAGIRIHQVHGPWPTDDKTAKKRKEKLIYMERAIRLTPVFGARYLIIHPDMPFGWDDEPEPAFSWQTNLDLFRTMLPIAEEEGVILCIENMPMRAHAISRTQRMYEFVQTINHPNLGMCLDTGHANVFADDCGDMVRLIAPVLKTLHVHDNMGDKDSHLPPYKGTINWERFTSALREIGFAGVLSIEATLAVRDKTQEGRAEAARCMAEIARKLADAAS
jgi:sugar phosphate isomerase/epimerase